MKTSLVSVSVVAMLAAVVSFLCVERPSPEHPATPAATAEGTKLLSRLPVAFVPNLGQWEHSARFVARVGAMTVFLEEKGWTFTLVERTTENKRENENASVRGVAVRMMFSGARAPRLVAEDQLPGRHNYFLGNDPTKWRSDVPLYRAVRYRDVHPGVDVRTREHDGHFEYDLLLQPDADIEPVEIAVEGIERMHVDGENALVMETRLGPVRMPAPLSWEEGPSGETSLVTCGYVLRGDDRFGFQVIGRRPGWTLIVDPGLVWSTYLGGTGNDYFSALALDAQGAASVAGSTSSIDFPTTPGAFDTSHNGNGDDVYVAKLSATGSSLVYSTFLGGTGGDYASALALDAQGAATVAGGTTSTGFPTTLGAFDTSFNGGVGGDAFVTRLSSTGSSLVYSTFLGGMGLDYAYALALDAQGATTVAGYTFSTDVPTTSGAFDTSYNGSGDAFVTRLDMLPTGVAAFGRSSPGCTGSLAISVTSIPRVGNTSFALTCGNAPANTSGLLTITERRFASPLIVLGAELWIDPFPLFVLLPASSNSLGASSVPLSIPNIPSLAGWNLFAQFFWAGPTSPPPCPPLGLSASNALDIRIQP